VLLSVLLKNFPVPSLIYLENGHRECIEVLLSNGADVNCPKAHGRTGLVFAAGEVPV